MDTILQQIYAPGCLIIGLSHFLHPRLWAELFVGLRQRRFAGFTIGMFTLPVGLLFIVGHNKWTWDWPLFITLTGWGMTIKSVVYLLFPKTANQLIDAGMAKPEWAFRSAGLIMVFFGGILTWQAFAA